MESMQPIKPVNDPNRPIREKSGIEQGLVTRFRTRNVIADFSFSDIILHNLTMHLKLIFHFALHTRTYSDHTHDYE